MKNFFLKIFFALLSLSSFAQEIKLDYSPSLFAKQKNILINNSTITNPLFPFSLKPGFIFRTAPPHTFGNCVPAITNGIHYTAFFCKLENKLHARFNIWIKLRAGDDESYRKMTEVP
jgi:hypothetical protein